MSKAHLTITSGPSTGRKFDLNSSKIVLGRHPDCDIVLDAGAVSRQHAQITLDGKQCFIEDLHSRNGTFVNDLAIEARQPLRDGDRVRICDLQLKFDEAGNSSGDTATFASSSSSHAVVVEETPSNSSKIMTKLGVSSESSKVLLEANIKSKLVAVLEITRSLKKSLSIEEVLPKILDSVFKIFLQADRAFIVLAEKNGKLVPKAVKFRRPDEDETARISRTIVHEVMDNRQAVLSADAATDERFQMSESIADFRIRSMLCAPLLDSEDKPLGVIQVDTLDQRNRFTDEDLEVLAGVAGQVGIAIENAQLHEAAIREQQTRGELEAAHRVQRSFLPSAPPELAGYRFFDYYHPARAVGGDYYDYIKLPDDCMALVMADVMGKGVGAALVMAKLSADTKYCLASEADVAVAVSRLNRSFCESGWQDQFVTMLVAVLSPSSGEIIVVNAGHEPPIVRYRGGKVEEPGQDEGGPPLGVDENHQYTSFKIQLAPGDDFATYTDGLIDAMNIKGDLYTRRRLRERVADEATSVDQLGNHILDDIKKFVEDQPQTDDMCLVCIGRQG